VEAGEQDQDLSLAVEPKMGSPTSASGPPGLPLHRWTGPAFLRGLVGGSKILPVEKELLGCSTVNCEKYFYRSICYTPLSLTFDSHSICKLAGVWVGGGQVVRRGQSSDQRSCRFRHMTQSSWLWTPLSSAHGLLKPSLWHLYCRPVRHGQVGYSLCPAFREHRLQFYNKNLGIENEGRFTPKEACRSHLL
jgi:hypothetical protein